MKRVARRRGAAAVEMAVTMVLLVPLIMYTLFLEDLLVYKLEAQEPTVVAGWDYAVGDYQDGKGLGRLPNMNQLKYCDHSAAFDSYDKKYDCNTDGIHHEAGTAHQCWLVTDAKQLACGNSAAVGREILPAGQEFQTWYQQFNKGGMASCKATLGVMNYFLVNDFFSWAGKEKVTEKKKLGGADAKTGSGNASVHKEAGGTAEADADETLPPPPPGPPAAKNPGAWILKEEVFAVLSDPWALNNIEETTAATDQQDHPFYQRASVYFEGAGGGMMQQGNQSAKDYREGLKELISDEAATDLMGDDPSTMPLTWKTAKERGHGGGYASGWKDSRMANAQSRSGNEYPKAWGPQ